MSGIFKAYDVRGIYPSELDESTARAIGRAFRVALTNEDLEREPTVVVGHDMRSHSEPLHASLLEGLVESGLDAIDIGLVTTPMNYFAVGHLEAAGGIQVTASHNPQEYNGFKFSRSDARPVSGDHGIPAIEERVRAGDFPRTGRGGTLERGDIMPDYRDHLLRFLQPIPESRPLKVVVDAANGMGCISLRSEQMPFGRRLRR